MLNTGCMLSILLSLPKYNNWLLVALNYIILPSILFTHIFNISFIPVNEGHNNIICKETLSILTYAKSIVTYN